MRNYKYFILNPNNSNRKLTPKQVFINLILIVSNVILIACICFIPIAAYYNSDKLDSSIDVQVKFKINVFVKKSKKLILFYAKEERINWKSKSNIH
jgi:hypothetical protein